MKAIYWQPGKISRRALMLICAVSLTGVATAELCRRCRQSGELEDKKLAAAELAARGIASIKAERLRRGHVIDPAHDPSESGMIGDYLTPVTSVSGHLESKQTSVNPNFAAVVVEMLHQAGVGEGDVVAVGLSGSFPTLDLCVASALETLKAEPVMIASAAASQFGANMPDFLWIDMERHLHDEGLISFRSVAASLGGYEDRAEGMADDGKRLLHEAVERNGLPLIKGDDYTTALEERMLLYREHAAGRPIKAYINIGGGTVSVGRSVGKKLYPPGLNMEVPPEAMQVDSVLTRFAQTGTPLIHLVEINKIAAQYQLPISPQELPEVGTGHLYYDTVFHRWVAGASLLSICGCLWWSAPRTTQSA